MARRVRGLRRTVRQLGKISKHFQIELPMFVKSQGENIMTESKQEVPVDEGTLRSTGHVTQPKIRFNKVSVKLRYGGPATPYAYIQHETPPSVFSHEDGQKWKFLEDPAMRAIPEMEKNLIKWGQAQLAEMRLRFRGT